jgi:hypothetical protein
LRAPPRPNAAWTFDQNTSDAPGHPWYNRAPKGFKCPCGFFEIEMLFRRPESRAPSASGTFAFWPPWAPRRRCPDYGRRRRGEPDFLAQGCDTLYVSKHGTSTWRRGASLTPKPKNHLPHCVAAPPATSTLLSLPSRAARVMAVRLGTRRHPTRAGVPRSLLLVGGPVGVPRPRPSLAVTATL